MKRNFFCIVIFLLAIFLISGFSAAMKIDSNVNTIKEISENETINEEIEDQGIFFDWATGYFRIRFDWDIGGGRVSPLILRNGWKYTEGKHFAPIFVLDFDEDPKSILEANYGVLGRDFSGSTHSISAFCAFYEVIEVEFYSWGWYEEISYIEVEGYSPLMKIS